jgi:ribosomal protein S19
MEDRFHDVLSSVDAKQGRSRLEPYGELVDELRRQGFTCRDITALLAEKCQLKTSKSAVNRLVRARARRRRNAVRQISRRVAIPPPMVAKKAGLHSGPGPSENEVQQRIAAMKARKPATMSSDNDFYFDPTEPLRLIDPGKRDSND